MKNPMKRTYNIDMFTVLLTAVFYGLLIIPIDLFMLLKSSSIGFFLAIRLAFRSTGWIMLMSALFIAALFIFIRIIDKIKPNVFKLPLQQAVLIGSGILVPLFFLLFDTFYDKFKVLVALELIGGIVAVLIAGSCYLLLRSGDRSHRLAAMSPKASVIGTLVIVILFGLSFVGGEGTKTVAESNNSTGKSDRPNILLIVMDTVRADHLSLYGYQPETTPFLKKMAEESAVFKNAFASSPWTLPSHASIFTGLYPSQHHTHAEHFWLDDDYRTLAEILSEDGYQAVSFSNNDYITSYHNLTQGFERTWYKGSWTDSIKNLATQCSSLGGSVVSFYSWLWNQIQIKILGKIIKNPASIWDYPDAATTNTSVIEWLNDDRDKRRPFFIFINYMDAHIPYNPDDKTARLFLNEQDLQNSYRLKLRFPPIEYYLDMSKGGYAETDIRIMRTLYDACIRHLDDELEKLILKLKQLGVYDKTLIIITSDHGEYLGTHNRLAHGLGLHDQVLHVPLIARYPKLFKPGTTYDTVVSLIDIYETILSFAKNKERPKGMPKSQLLFDLKKGFRPNVFAEFRFPLHLLINASLRENNSKLFIEQKTIRSKTDQLIWKSRGEPEFYNMIEDPLQLSNLYSKANKKAETMSQQLVSHFKSLNYIPYHTSQDVKKGTDISEKEKRELLERLRGIGYIK
jgi:arylsulfatase A-like enzyme